jgi:hypothetical protein
MDRQFLLRKEGVLAFSLHKVRSILKVLTPLAEAAMKYDESPSYPHSREHFRVPYEPSDAPRFATMQNTFTVLDLSEGGLRLSIQAKQRPNTYVLDQLIHGTLTLPEARGTLSLSGQVIRITDDYLAVKLMRESYIPLPQIMVEQRVMIQKLPHNAVLAIRSGLRRITGKL